MPSDGDISGPEELEKSLPGGGKLWRTEQGGSAASRKSSRDEDSGERVKDREDCREGLCLQSACHPGSRDVTARAGAEPDQGHTAASQTSLFCSGRPKTSFRQPNPTSDRPSLPETLSGLRWHLPHCCRPPPLAAAPSPCLWEA